jgi:hypothetical protein
LAPTIPTRIFACAMDISFLAFDGRDQPRARS